MDSQNSGQIIRFSKVASSSLFVVFFLVGCQSLQTRGDRCQQFNEQPGSQYQYSGKIALSDGTEGGSGRFSWQSDKQGHVTALFKAPMGQGSWLLTESDSGASMLVDKQKTYFAPQAGQLISDFMGWQVPWQALKQWVIGEAYQANGANMQLNPEGKTIEEQGWHISYSQYQSYPQGCLPQNITAQKDNYRIKLVIKDWQ